MHYIYHHVYICIYPSPPEYLPYVISRDEREKRGIGEKRETTSQCTNSITWFRCLGQHVVLYIYINNLLTICRSTIYVRRFIIVPRTYVHTRTPPTYTYITYTYTRLPMSVYVYTYTRTTRTRTHRLISYRHLIRGETLLNIISTRVYLYHHTPTFLHFK